MQRRCNGLKDHRTTSQLLRCSVALAYVIAHCPMRKEPAYQSPRGRSRPRRTPMLEDYREQRCIRLSSLTGPGETLTVYR
jgi:hypothetical protein